MVEGEDQRDEDAVYEIKGIYIDSSTCLEVRLIER